MCTQSKLIDTRDSCFFNGWSEGTYTIGGHIQGALNFSVSWLSQLTDHEIISQLERMHIKKSCELILYGKESHILEAKLKNLGFPHVIRDENLINKAINNNEQLAKLQHFEKLVHPKWLLSEIEKQTSIEIYEVSWGFESDYKAGHIPTSKYVDLRLFEDHNTWNKTSNKKIHSLIMKYGIDITKPIILYSRNKLEASRLAVILLETGAEDVRILDGGFNSWLNKKYPLEQGIKHININRKDKNLILKHTPYLIDINTVQHSFNKSNSNIISIRSFDEYSGNQSGYCYIDKGGRIQNSIHGEDLDAYHNLDGTMFNYELIEKGWLGKGISPNHENIFYCGTGWRASEVLYFAYIMGWKNVFVYDGGWFEWNQKVSIG